MKKLYTLATFLLCKRDLNVFISYDSDTMRVNKLIILLFILFTGTRLQAQTLQQVTANGNVTNAGITVNGTLTLPGNTELQGGNGDNASFTVNNFYFRGWWGLGMKSFDGAVKGYYDFRTGTWDVKNGYKLDGLCGTFTGNGDNASFSTNNMYVQSWYGIGFKSGFDNTNRIYFNTRNGDIATQGNVFAGGNIGIGTTAPGNKLEVNGGISIRSATGTKLSFFTTGGSETDATYSEGRLDIFKDATGTAPNRSAVATFDLYHGYGNHPTSADGFLFKYRNIDPNGGIAGGTNNTLMYLRGDGFVGIGTKSPDSKLTVKGKIHAEEVKIDNQIPVPDYVFNKDYSLMSLTDVKKYIDKHHHLPEVPSAAQVEKEGLKLGEMNLILLKKVEELTLHLIDKDNQMKEMQTQINELKKILTKETVSK